MKNIKLAAALTSFLFSQASQDQVNFTEYCFRISPQTTIGLRKVNTTPEKFVSSNPSVLAAINGTYCCDQNKMQGIAYLAENQEFGSKKSGHIRGYFTVDRSGRKIEVTRMLKGRLSDYWIVLGTYPLLVVNNRIDEQANARIYQAPEYRSAIGNKSSNICFAASSQELEMSKWAQELQNAGYDGAINLDGGFVSELAVRNGRRINVSGPGKSNTKLVIFAYKR